MNARKEADTITEEETSPGTSTANPMLQKRLPNVDASAGAATVNKQASKVVKAGYANSLFSKKKRPAGKLARGRERKGPAALMAAMHLIITRWCVCS